MARASRNFRRGQDQMEEEWRSNLFNVDERNLDKLKLPKGTEAYYVVDDALGDDSSEESERGLSVGQCLMTCELTSRAPIFDSGAFFDDFQMYKYREELEMVSKICNQFAESGCEDFRVRFDENTFPESFYHAKLKERFGELDTTSDEYAVLFENFKPGIIIGYKQWAEGANNILKDIQETTRNKDEAVSLLKQHLVVTKPALCLENRRKTHGKTVHLQLGQQEALGPEECVRLRNSERQNRDIPVSYKFLVRERNDEIFYQQVTDKLQHTKFQGDVKYPLIVSILKVLGDFPMGTTPGFLFEEFDRRKGYKIDYYGLGFDTFEELLATNSHIFRIMRDENTTLVFPYWMYWKISVSSLKRELYHDLILLVRGSSKPVPLDDVTKQLQQKLSIRVHPASWGIESHELFFRVLLCEWDPRNLDLEIVRAKEYGPDGSYKYLIQAPSSSEEDPLEMFSMPLPKKKTVDAPKLPRIEEDVEEIAADGDGVSQIAENAKTSSTQHSNPGREDFVLCTKTAILRSSDFLRPGQRFFAQPELMITPGNFFVTPIINVDQRDEFLIEMTDVYILWMKDSETKLAFSCRREDCIVGSYVAIEYETDWHRGRIIQAKHRKYKILLVDVGYYLKDVPLSDLRYLHKNFQSLPEQSFCCSLRQNLLHLTFGETNVKDDNYPVEILQEFYSYLKYRKLQIRLVQKIQELDSWEVDVYIATANSKVHVNVAMELMLSKLRW